MCTWLRSSFAVVTVCRFQLRKQSAIQNADVQHGVWLLSGVVVHNCLVFNLRKGPSNITCRKTLKDSMSFEAVDTKDAWSFEAGPTMISKVRRGRRPRICMPQNPKYLITVLVLVVGVYIKWGVCDNIALYGTFNSTLLAAETLANATFLAQGSSGQVRARPRHAQIEKCNKKE